MHSFGYIFNRFIGKPLLLEEDASEAVYTQHQDLERKAYEIRLTHEFEENKLIIAHLEKQLFDMLMNRPTGTPYKSKDDKRAARKRAAEQEELANLPELVTTGW